MRPRTIFGAIVVWLLSTVVLSAVGFVATYFLMSAGLNQSDGFLRRFQAFELGEAQIAFESGGPDKLASYLRRLDDTLGARHLLIDPDNRSLVDGVDHSKFVNPGGFRAFLKDGHPRPFSMVVASPDRRYRMIIVAPPPPFAPWDYIRGFLWLPILIAALCYVLAVHLAAPLHKLTRAVERFGHGDLSARVGTMGGRRDEIGELARAFDAMADRTQALMKAERQLLQDVSHELRTPLARLGFGIELARTNPDREAALARVKKDLTRLNTLVDELLQLTRAEMDPAERNTVDVDLVAMLHDVVDDCSMEAEAMRRSLNLSIETDQAATVPGDPELLRRACENVIRNAIRHTGPETSVDISLSIADRTTNIDVRDRGPGVPEPDLERIFQPFYRVDSHRDRTSGGIGLGLSIARRAFSLHGGRITATNADPGLWVRLELPHSEIPKPL